MLVLKIWKYFTRKAKQSSLQVFASIATVGSISNIQKHKLALIADIESLYEEIKGANANKDPYKNIEFYLIPGSVAFVAYAARVVTDVTCLNLRRPNSILSMLMCVLEPRITFGIYTWPFSFSVR